MFTSKEVFKELFTIQLNKTSGKTVETASNLDAYHALASLIKEEISLNWMETKDIYNKQSKQVYYFSMEFLIGRLLGNNLLNLGTLAVVQQGLDDLGFSLDSIEDQEQDAGLGNGGLGRLAACFLDSFASLGLAGHGNGMRYRFGMFEQRIIDGNQIELPDQWLVGGYDWEVRKPEDFKEVRFGGQVTPMEREDGHLSFNHSNYEHIRAVPYDVPVIGYNNNRVNTLRLWSAEPNEDDVLKKAKLDPDGKGYLEHQRDLEEISNFLYPDDSTEEGRRLRLKQEYFLVSAGVQDAINTFEHSGEPWTSFPTKVLFHINDTHPALVIPELMRILMDEKKLEWEEAWDITQSTVSYTNHTTLKEALETWPIYMFQSLLPRVYMIVEEINERFCKSLWEMYPGDFERIAKLAIIANDQVKMAHLAIVGSYSVNGVAQVHTEILKSSEMKLFYETFPTRFNNKTNGVTHRRWLMHANPKLSEAITDMIGKDWMTSPIQLKELLKKKDDSAFLNHLDDIKQYNKQKLAKWIATEQGHYVDPLSIFDVHIKRLHGYKRQLLNALHVMHLYNKMKMNPSLTFTPRTFIFAAKAAPSYHFAKKVIRLINRIADVINNDPLLKDRLKVIFIEDYSVSLAERLIPAANVSEQISLATKEASGTGNMKLMMNGALTLGTMDGANVEIHELVGKENMYSFGLSCEEVKHYQKLGHYRSREVYEQDDQLRNTLNQLIDYSPFSKGHNEFQDLFDALITYNDEYFVLHDFASYAEAHEQISLDYEDKKQWNQKSLVNIALSGTFSSDRTIQQYASDIWGISPCVERTK